MDAALSAPGLSPLEPACTRSTCRIPGCVSHTGVTEEAAVARLEERARQNSKSGVASVPLFEDPDFPAANRSLFRDPERPWDGHADLTLVEWRRPSEFCPGEPRVFVDGAHPGDVLQGNLGDCWLLGAFSVIAARPELLERLFLSTRNADLGVYTIAVYKEEYWHRIVIDDRIPYQTADGVPLYASCRDPDEIWVPLLEKAFAKAHGCYENLTAGFVEHGLKDLTGGFPQTLKLEGAAARLWGTLSDAVAAGSLAGCSCSLLGGSAIDRGILKGHTYGVLDARTVRSGRTGRHLLRLRNPWGRTEWKGPWGDGSKEWTKELQKELGYAFGDDGTFWMAWEDFVKEFTTLHLCRIFPDEWTGQRVLGEWRKGVSAWGCPGDSNRDWHKNRQFHLQLFSKTKLFVVLSQSDVRIAGKDQSEYPAAIGFFITKAPDASAEVRLESIDSNDDIATTSGPFKPSREVSTFAVLEAGHYKVLPMTYEAGQEARYGLAVWSSPDVDLQGETPLPKFAARRRPSETWIVSVIDASRGEMAAPSSKAPNPDAGSYKASRALIRLAPPDEPEAEPPFFAPPRLRPAPFHRWLHDPQPPPPGAGPRLAPPPPQLPPPAPAPPGDRPASPHLRPLAPEDEEGDGLPAARKRDGRARLSGVRLSGLPATSGPPPAPNWDAYVWIQVAVGPRARAARAPLPSPHADAVSFPDTFLFEALPYGAELALDAFRGPLPRTASLGPPPAPERLGGLRLALASLPQWAAGEAGEAELSLPLKSSGAGPAPKFHARLALRSPLVLSRHLASWPPPPAEPTKRRPGSQNVVLEYTDKWGESRPVYPRDPDPPEEAEWEDEEEPETEPPPPPYPAPPTFAYPPPYPYPSYPYPYPYLYPYPHPFPFYPSPYPAYALPYELPPTPPMLDGTASARRCDACSSRAPPGRRFPRSFRSQSPLPSPPALPS